MKRKEIIVKVEGEMQYGSSPSDVKVTKIIATTNNGSRLFNDDLKYKVGDAFIVEYQKQNE